MTLHLNNKVKLLLWIVLFEGVGFALSGITKANIDNWYIYLDKSTLTPPGYMFAIVWPILYACLAIIAWYLADSNKYSPTIFRAFTLQMLMNWAWTPLFFGLHVMKFSALWLICLTLLNLILAFIFFQHSKKMFLLLMPYIFWLTFASYLNIVIAFLN